MDNDCKRVFERLYEQKDSGKHLELADFADLGLSNNTVLERLQDLHHIGWAHALVHSTSRTAGGVDRVVATITEEGCKAFEANYT